MSVAETERFARDLDRVAPGDGRLLLAVSGGPDSMAMLVLAHATIPGRIAVATVDHGLRAGSADEAALVARTCAAMGLAHAILRSGDAIAGASLQAQARAVRYALLAEHAAATGAVATATAHHVDDQAETFLMRAARASGLSGLAGIRSRAVIADTVVVRPLLDWRRTELRAVVRRAGLRFVDDAANRDPRHDRTRFRRLLADHGWIDPQRVARSAAVLADVDRDLALLIDWLWDERVVVEAAEVRIGVGRLPREARRRLAMRAVTTVRERAAIVTPEWVPGTRIDPLIDALEHGRRATRAGVLASARADVWRFRIAPPRRDG